MKRAVKGEAFYSPSIHHCTNRAIGAHEEGCINIYPHDYEFLGRGDQLAKEVVKMLTALNANDTRTGSGPSGEQGAMRLTKRELR